MQTGGGLGGADFATSGGCGWQPNELRQLQNFNETGRYFALISSVGWRSLNFKNHRTDPFLCTTHTGTGFYPRIGGFHLTATNWIDKPADTATDIIPIPTGGSLVSQWRGTTWDAMTEKLLQVLGFASAPPLGKFPARPGIDIHNA